MGGGGCNLRDYFLATVNFFLIKLGQDYYSSNNTHNA